MYVKLGLSGVRNSDAPVVQIWWSQVSNLQR